MVAATLETCPAAVLLADLYLQNHALLKQQS